MSLRLNLAPTLKCGVDEYVWSLRPRQAPSLKFRCDTNLRLVCSVVLNIFGGLSLLTSLAPSLWCCCDQNLLTSLEPTLKCGLEQCLRLVLSVFFCLVSCEVVMMAGVRA